jgi:hypothetical protein
MVSFGPNQEIPSLEELDLNDAIDSITLVNSFKIFDKLRLEAGGAQSEEKPAKKGRRSMRGD